MSLQIAQDCSDFAPVFEEVFSQERDNLVPHHFVQIGSGVAAGKVSVADLVVTIVEILDAFIDDCQKARQVDPGTGCSVL